MRMNAKKCDRCGRYYDKNSKHRDESFSEEAYAAGAQIYNSNNKYWGAWDLCDDCLTEFFNWVNMKGR